MTEQTTTDTPIVEPLDLSSAAVEATVSSTPAVPPAPKTVSPSPSAPLPTDFTTEQRGEPRYLVKWQVTALLEGGQALRGRIRDISFKGTSMLFERNLQQIKTLTLQIHIPPLDTDSGVRIVQVEGKLVYTLHDSEEPFFRIGISFTRFKSKSDEFYLQTRLTEHHLKVGA